MAIRFGHVVLAYFVMGAVMYGGGAIAWDDSGMGGYLIEDPDTAQTNQNVTEQIRQSGGPIQQAATSFTGGLVAIWGFIIQLLAYLFWPIAVLVSVNAPPRAIVLLGGMNAMAFIVSIIRIIRGSA